MVICSTSFMVKSILCNGLITCDLVTMNDYIMTMNDNLLTLIPRCCASKYPFQNIGHPCIGVGADVFFAFFNFQKQAV